MVQIVGLINGPDLNLEILSFRISGRFSTPISSISRIHVALDLRPTSLQMDGPDIFRTPPSYHKTLSCDLGLIHRAHQGFAYQDLVTCENEGPCPLVSRVSKRRNPFTLKSIQGFTYRDFTTGKGEGSCPWVSWVSKR
jgi:hypothetical protein